MLWLVPRPLYQGAAGLALLALIFWRANPFDLDDQYRDFDVWPVAGVVLLNAPILALVTLRGWLLLTRQGYAVPFVGLFPIATLGHVGGSLTPASMGDLVRVPFFKDRHAVPYAEGLAVVLYERGLSVVTLALSTGAAAAWATLPIAAATAVTFAAAVGLAGSWRIVALVVRRLEPLRTKLTERRERASAIRRGLSALGDSLEPLERLLRDDRLSASVVSLSLGIFAVMAAQMWLVTRALGLSLSAAESWTAHGAGVLAAVASLVPLGLGSMDATLAVIVGEAEGGLAAGAAAVVLVRAATTLPQGLAAFGSYLWLASRRSRTIDTGAATPIERSST